MPRWIIEAVEDCHTEWIESVFDAFWAGIKVAVRGTLRDVRQLPGFVARAEKEHVGLITYDIRNSECEIVSVNALKQWEGIGSSLLAAVEEVAAKNGCHRLWVITTNDNIEALRFYQRRGYTLCSIYCNAVEAARRLKPSIPKTGRWGIPLRDEIELEKLL